MPVAALVWTDGPDGRQSEEKPLVCTDEGHLYVVPLGVAPLAATGSTTGLGSLDSLESAVLDLGDELRHSRLVVSVGGKPSVGFQLSIEEADAPSGPWRPGVRPGALVATLQSLGLEAYATARYARATLLNGGLPCGAVSVHLTAIGS